jgi:hypothetical protein
MLVKKASIPGEMIVSVFSTGMPRNQVLVSPEQLAMGRELFTVNRGAQQPLSDDDMWRSLHELRSAPELRPFRLYLVGSRVEAGHETSDVDLILSPRPGSSFSDLRIERALWHCRAYGLHQASPTCLIDPAFRREGPATQVAAFAPERILHTAKLFSPRIVALIRERRITRYRRFGRFCIEFWRPASESGFYSKLPELPGEEGCRYLRPAIPVTNELP